MDLTHASSRIQKALLFWKAVAVTAFFTANNIYPDQPPYPVYAVGGDIGGMREVYEGMQVLEKRGVSVKYHVDADARQKLGS